MNIKALFSSMKVRFISRIKKSSLSKSAKTFTNEDIAKRVLNNVLGSTRNSAVLDYIYTLKNTFLKVYTEATKFLFNTCKKVLNKMLWAAKNVLRISNKRNYFYLKLCYFRIQTKVFDVSLLAKSKISNILFKVLNLLYIA